MLPRDSLAAYFASSYFGGDVEDFLEFVKRLVSKVLNLCVNLISHGFDAA
jgi:hypothetical protein